MAEEIVNMILDPNVPMSKVNERFDEIVKERVRAKAA